MKRSVVAIAMLLASGCESKQTTVPTAAELPDLVARYEAFITNVAVVTATGDCAEKGAVLGELFAAHRETDARMRSAMVDPARKVELQRLIDARGAKISDPEIAFADVKHACAGKPGFPAYEQ